MGSVQQISWRRSVAESVIRIMRGNDLLPSAIITKLKNVTVKVSLFSSRVKSNKKCSYKKNKNKIIILNFFISLHQLLNRDLISLHDKVILLLLYKKQEMFTKIFSFNDMCFSFIILKTAIWSSLVSENCTVFFRVVTQCSTENKQTFGRTFFVYYFLLGC